MKRILGVVVFSFLLIQAGPAVVAAAPQTRAQTKSQAVTDKVAADSKTADAINSAKALADRDAIDVINKEKEVDDARIDLEDKKRELKEAKEAKPQVPATIKILGKEVTAFEVTLKKKKEPLKPPERQQVFQLVNWR